MELQSYLHQYGLESLCRQYFIKINRHQQYPNLVCFKYSQIESPMAEKIVQQCRGIILDESHHWQIVSYPYTKFFNYGEPLAAAIDWNTAKVYDKLDGSLMVLYYYDHQWRVQSSGTPDAAGQVNGFGFNFAALFWKVWQELNYRLPQEKHYCFMFELMTVYNRIVVKPKENQLVLHGVRNLQTLQEEDPQRWGDQQNWQVVKSFNLTNWHEILQAAATLDPMDAEGYIICDGHFNRVKVKSPQYVALAHFREGFSTRKMLEIIVNNEGDEFLSYYPEWTESYQQIKEKYQNLIQEIESVYEAHKTLPTQKDFALAIKHLPYSGTLFSLRAGKVASIRESLKNASIPKIEELLGVNYIHFGL